ncbi:MAG: PAS domain S-box protein [Betaproteobacteria bacterium]|nr:PAS domain S-box protein [Betaproteobacteria bacterium]
MGSQSGEKRYVRKDGKVIWVRRTASLAYDESGKPMFAIRVIEDITERKELEQQFQATFDQAAVGIIHTSLDRRLLLANRKFCEITGYDFEELRGREIRDLSHPEDVGEDRGLEEKLLAGEIGTFSSSRRYIRKDGKVIWVKRTTSLARDPEGRPKNFIRVVEDITDSKEAEERYLATFEHAPVGIMHTDMDNDRILHANPKLRAMLGYTQDELLSMTTDQILHPDHVGGDRPKYREKLLKGELDSFSSERLYLRKDGSPLWVNRTVSLVRDAAGKPQYFIRIVEDISERKRAEEAVAREHSLLRTIIDTLPDYIYVKDRAGRFRLANEAWLKARRITAEDIAGKTVFDMFPREVAERMAAQDEAIVKTGAPLLDFEQLIIVKTPDGEPSKTRWASTTKVPMRDSSGDIIGTVGISRDITERRLSTRRRAMEHAVTRVLADSATLNEALPAILQNICEALGWACGAYWQWDEKAEILRCVETWHVEAEEVAAFSAFSKQAVYEAPAWRDGAPKTESGGLVRGVWFSGAPVWLPDVAQQPGFRRGPMAAKAGLHCAFGFPVLAGSRPLGVMEFYGRDIKQPDEALLQITRSIGSQIGQFDQRKQAEEAQHASEATLSATFEQAGVGMALRGIDPRNPRWLRVNQKLCDILGYTREELLRLSSVDVTPPEERRLAIDYNERLLRGEVVSYSREKRYLRKDGQIIWATISLSAVRGPDGAPTHVISVIQDVTDRKRAEAALQESEEHLRAMFAHASVGITVSALDLHYIDVNDKYCDIVGYSREELLKMSVRDVNVSKNLASMEEHRRKLFTGEIESMVREKQLLCKDGSQVWVSMVTSVIRDHNGGPKHFISVIQDVSQRKRAEEALRESEEQFRQLAGNIPQVFWITDVERKQTIYVSSAAEKLIGRPLEEIQANPRMLIRAVYKADRPRLNAARKAAAEGGYDVTYRIVRPEGAIRWVHDRAFPVHDADGNVYRIAGITEDITERRRADEALQESEEQFRQLANNIPQVFWITDAEQKELIYLSPAYEVVSGQSIEQVKPDPRKWLEMVHQDDRDRVAQARKRAADAQYDEVFRIVRPDGSIRWMRDRAFPVRDAEGFVYRIAGIAEDITERKAAEERLMHLAHYDVLTSLPNRVLFYDRLRQALAQAKRNQWIVGVMFMDVDRFKNVNDTLGHAVGGKLLQRISERVARSVRSGDTVGRLGGDEFAIVLSNLSSAQDANLVAQKMMASFNEPFKLDGAELYMTASIGITLYPDDSTDQDTLIKNADTAMYRSKEVGRNSYQFYTPEMNARALQVLGMESPALRTAISPVSKLCCAGGTPSAG